MKKTYCSIPLLLITLFFLSCQKSEPFILWEKIYTPDNSYRNWIDYSKTGIILTSHSAGNHGGSYNFHFLNHSGNEMFRIEEGYDETGCSHGSSYYTQINNNGFIYISESYMGPENYGAMVDRPFVFYPQIIMYDSNGIKKWERKIYVLNSLCHALGIENNPLLSSTDDLYFIIHKNENVLLLKIDVNGKIAWQKNLITNKKNGQNIVTLFKKDNGFVIYGNHNDEIWFKKYNTEGIEIESKTYTINEKYRDVLFINENKIFDNYWKSENDSMDSKVILLIDSVFNIKSKIITKKNNDIHLCYDKKSLLTYRRNNKLNSDLQLSKMDIEGKLIWETNVSGFGYILTNNDFAYTVYSDESSRNSSIEQINLNDGKLMWKQKMNLKMQDLILTDDNNLMLLLSDSLNIIVRKINIYGDNVWEQQIKNVDYCDQYSSKPQLLKINKDTYVLGAEITIKNEHQQSLNYFWTLCFKDSAVKSNDKQIMLICGSEFSDDGRKINYEISRNDEGFQIRNNYIDLEHDDHLLGESAKYSSQEELENDKIRASIVKYHRLIEKRSPDEAFQMWAKKRQPKVNKKLIYSVSQDIEYYKIKSIQITKKEKDYCETTALVIQKMKDGKEECWETNFKLIKEEGRWKIWTSPGRKSFCM